MKKRLAKAQSKGKQQQPQDIESSSGESDRIITTRRQASNQMKTRKS